MRHLLPLTICIAFLAPAVFAQTPIKFLHPIPAAYDPSLEIPQYIDVSPNMTLPKGHIYYKPPTREGWTVQQSMAKGVTHWAAGTLDKGASVEQFRKNPQLALREYFAVPRTREIFSLNQVDGKWWPNGPLNEKEAREKARQVSISSRLWVGETMEGDDWMPSDNPMWGWFYDELVKRYEAQKAKDGIPYYIAHNYFSQFPGVYQLGQGKREEQEALYETAPEKWPKSHYAAGQSIGKPNTVVEGIYINAPDLHQQQLMSAIMRMELIQKMGKHTGLFVFNVHEWRPGFVARIEYPEGIFYRKDKLPIDPNLQISLAFLAQEYGTMFIEWGLMGFQPAAKKPVDLYRSVHAGMDEWIPKGQRRSADFPFYSETGGNRFNILPHLGDFTHFGTVLWAYTGGQVAGGKAEYATYKLDGKQIDRARNGSDLVSAYYEKRGVVRTRTLGRKMLIFYFNMFADNERHVLEVQNPANPTQKFTGTVCGNGVHAVVVNL